MLFHDGKIKMQILAGTLTPIKAIFSFKKISVSYWVFFFYLGVGGGGSFILLFFFQFVFYFCLFIVVFP